MKLTIIGSSGSLAGFNNPASCYLLAPDDGSEPVILDIGPGAMGGLAAATDPSRAHVAITHLHADHCLDFPSLLVWRRYHPTTPAAGRHMLIGPQHTYRHLAAASAATPDTLDNFTDTFDIHTWTPGYTHTVGAFDITPHPAVHPIETYLLHIRERATGHTLVYSADTADTPHLRSAARGAHTLLCEAGWGPTGENTPPSMHLSGVEAGDIAADANVSRLILTHIPPWCDPAATLEAARSRYDGPIHLATPQDTFAFD